MPKFKQKNRKKRKYIKRSSPVSEISLTKSWFIKLMPYILMAVGGVTTLAISPPALQTIQPIQPIQLDFTRPTIVFDGILTIFRELFTFFSAIQAYLQLLIGNIVTFLTTITIQTVTTILHLLAYIISLITFAGMTIYNSFISLTAYILSLASIAFDAIGGLISQIATFIWHILTTIWHGIVVATKTLIALIQTIMTAIFNALSFALDKTVQGLNAVWYFLMTPVRALVAYYMQLKPYIDYVLNNFKESALYLRESMSLAMGMK